VFYISNILKAKSGKTNKPIKSFLWRTKHTIKLAVVPHKKNNYRPHLIRRYGLIAIVFVVIGMQLGYNGIKTGDVLGLESDITISSLLDSTNQTRAQAGQPPLIINDKLNKAAYLKAQDMLAKQYWAHNSPDGTPPWKWFGDVGYNYSQAGENLAKNFTSTKGVITAWLDSPEHKAIVLKSDYQDVGFAVVSGEIDNKPTSLVVALYGSPAESVVAGAGASFSDASQSGQLNVLTQFAVATQSITPAVLGGLTIIALAIVVAAAAYAYRRNLPKSLRQSWYRHHGLFKIVGLLLIGIIVIFMYGGGQV
jgi:hypothetical protein